MVHGIDTHVWHFSLYRTLSHLMTFEVKKKKKKKERATEHARKFVLSILSQHSPPLFSHTFSPTGENSNVRLRNEPYHTSDYIIVHVRWLQYTS